MDVNYGMPEGTAKARVRTRSLALELTSYTSRSRLYLALEVGRDLSYCNNN